MQKVCGFFFILMLIVCIYRNLAARATDRITFKMLHMAER